MPKDINTVGSTNANKVFDLPLHLQPGQVNTLSFSQDSISSMQLTAKGELEISFRDGSKVTIADFNELADSAKSCGRDTLIQLSDNTIIYPDQLRDQLAQHGGVDFVAQNDGVITFDEPKAGQILTKNIEAGQEYKLGFTLDGVNAAQSGHNLLLTFKDGGVLVLNNYFTAVNSDLPPAMTLANGTTIDANALLTSCKLVEVPNAAEAVLASVPPQSELRQSVPNVEPASGEEATVAAKAKDVAKIAPASGADVANIEPAAGDGAGRVSGSARGYGFGSSIDNAAFNGQNPIGAIGATALNYGAPNIGSIPRVPGVPGVLSIPDDKPSLGLGAGIVDETNIGSIGGVIPVNYGRDGPGLLTLNSSFSSEYPLTSHGVPVDVSLSGNTYTGTANGLPIFTLVLDPVTGAYTFTQIRQLDHVDPTNPNDSVSLVFGVTATDRDGDTATTTITIKVLDDGPVAVDDGSFVANDTLTVAGNVLTNDDSGSDGLGRVINVSFNGTSYVVPLVGSISVVGNYGALVISSDGTYSYTSSNTALGKDVFNYTMVDYDGDPSTALLSLEVKDLDTTPIAANAENQIDETNVAPDGTESVSGHVVVDFRGDGPGVVDASGAFSSGGSLKGGALTSNGVPVAVTMSGDVYTGKAGDKVVFTLRINDDGTYTYTQVGQLDHADGSNPNDVISLSFGFKATDADGDVANGTITIKVLDDAPVAVDDSNLTVTQVVSGNVLSNDNQGIDAPAPVVRVSYHGVDYSVPSTGSATIIGDHGNLIIKADGNYTYTPTSAGSDNFTYAITDYDGDVSTAVLALRVTDTVCVDLNINSNADDVCVKEDGSIAVPVVANVTGGNGNEILTLTLTGVPVDWNFSAAGWVRVLSPTKELVETYTITLPAGQTNYTGNFNFAPPSNSDVDLNGLKVTASVFDPDLSLTKTSTDNFNIIVDAVADVPLLNVSLPSYWNDGPDRWTFSNYYNYKYYGSGVSYDLNISGHVTDTDGSEKVVYYTIEVPKTLADFGFYFNKGEETSHGVWKIAVADIVGLQIVMPPVPPVDGAWWNNIDYLIPQGIHNFTITVVSQETNLSGLECDTADNTNSNVAHVQIVIFSSPLVIDLNGDGINLTDADHGVYFDINGDGVVDKTGWVSSDDGLLALDKNHNGSIDGQSELFGGNNIDGFSILSQYDDNHDGVIDNKDAVWKDLSVWKDSNHDGLTQNGELLSMHDLDFASISLDAKATNYEISGNGISAESTITSINGGQSQIVDAWFEFYNGADAEQMAVAQSKEIAQPQPAIINNFDMNEDKIDLSTLVDCDTCNVTKAIQDFVFSRTEDGNTIISLDKTGSGSASAAVDVVVLKDVVINNVDDIVQITQQQQAQSGFGTV